MLHIGPILLSPDSIGRDCMDIFLDIVKQLPQTERQALLRTQLQLFIEFLIEKDSGEYHPAMTVVDWNRVRDFLLRIAEIAGRELVMEFLRKLKQEKIEILKELINTDLESDRQLAKLITTDFLERTEKEV